MKKKSAFTLLELTVTIAITGVLVIGVLTFSKGIINSVKDFKSKFPAFSYVEIVEEKETKPPKPSTAPSLGFSVNGGVSVVSLNTGSSTHSNRSYTITSVHEDYIDAYWYKTNQDSNYSNPTFTFTELTRVYFLTTTPRISDELVAQGFTILSAEDENILEASHTNYDIQLYKDFEAGTEVINLVWSQAGVIIIVNQVIKL